MLTLDRLKELLNYNSETGELTWRITNSNRVRIGKIAGHISKDYLMVRIDRKMYAAHRLIWYGMTGKWPNEFIDHIDRNKLNNKWNNLREATAKQNAGNQFRNTNKSGFKGVSWSKRRNAWLAQITVNYKTINLGCYATPEEASKIYQDAAKHHFGAFAN